jgi:hypothetical protein
MPGFLAENPMTCFHKPLLAALLCASMGGPALAQTHHDSANTIIPGEAPIYLYVSAGASQMALVVGTDTGLTVPPGATIAWICVETANVRYRDDGTAATASLGIPVTSGSCFAYAGPLAALSFTAQSGSPTIDVSYYHAN